MSPFGRAMLDAGRGIQYSLKGISQAVKQRCEMTWKVWHFVMYKNTPKTHLEMCVCVLPRVLLLSTKTERLVGGGGVNGVSQGEAPLFPLINQAGSALAT